MSGSLHDAAAATAIANATIHIQGTELVAISDAQGAFHFFAVPVGVQILVVEHVAYATLTHTLVVEVGAELRVPLRLELAATASPAGSRSGRNEILRDEISVAARRGLDLIELIRQRLPSIRIRDDGVLGTCIEYRGGAPGALCRQLGLVVDGVSMMRPSIAFGGIVLDDVERIQLLSPGEAGTRYGGVGGWGILTVETRRGVAASPAPVADRMIAGFDWSDEPRPYPWAKVLLSTAVANGAALSVSYYTNDCLAVSRKVQHVAIRSECGSWGTVGSVFLMTALPSLTSSLAARWAGSTPRSHGRFGPSAVIGSSLTVGGYVALLYGDAKDSQGVSILGVTILAVGSPLFTTLADRALRVLR